MVHFQPESTKFIADDYAVATLPGLTLLNAEPLAARDMRPLLGGLTESVDGMPALKHVGDELRDIQDTSEGKGTILLNDEFTLKNLDDTLGSTPFTVVHLASHARFGAGPEDTY